MELFLVIFNVVLYLGDVSDREIVHLGECIYILVGDENSEDRTRDYPSMNDRDTFIERKYDRFPFIAVYTEHIKSIQKSL